MCRLHRLRSSIRSRARLVPDRLFVRAAVLYGRCVAAAAIVIACHAVQFLAELRSPRSGNMYLARTLTLAVVRWPCPSYVNARLDFFSCHI